MQYGEVVQDAKGTPCPWCTVTVHMKHVGQKDHSRRDQREGGRQEDRNWVVALYECPACGEVNIRLRRLVTTTRLMSNGVPAGGEQSLDERLVHPASAGRSPPPPEVPPEYAQDYREACAILDLSPQASAALSRRLLQGLLRGPGQIPRKRDLHDEIEEAVTRGMRSDIAEQLHMVRVVGNFAAHPMKDTNTGSVLPVEPAEAEHLLGVVHLLFDNYFVGPAKIAAMKTALNAKLTAAGKPLLK